MPPDTKRRRGKKKDKKTHPGQLYISREGTKTHTHTNTTETEGKTEENEVVWGG
jgi:hypothetical protein